ncbi:MAG: Gfo/Idh/MocA family oxidoreductase, partial [Rhodovibrionaceae bacterium]
MASGEALGIGILGLGTAGRMLIPAIDAHPDCALRAIADPAEEVRAEVAAGRDIALCEDIESLVQAEGVDAVYVATPTPLHAAHTQAAAAAGKHVVVEKPMAVDLAEAEAMIAAADKAGVTLMVGHSRSFDPAFRRMREIIDTGRLGHVRMIHQVSYTDWIYRPRRPEELDSALGGGITFRQGAHQFDVIRLLAGGLVESLRAHSGDWDPIRPAVGAHTV